MITKTQKVLAFGIANEFMGNYNAIRNPQSLSYNDNFCGAWLNDQVAKFKYESWDAMAKACRAVLKAYKPAPVAKKKAKLHIEVVKYMGKFGSFAAGESEMYRAELTGVNGKRQALPDTQACYSEYEGHPEKRYAAQRANAWAALLGCPIIFVDKTVGKVA